MNFFPLLQKCQELVSWEGVDSAEEEADRVVLVERIIGFLRDVDLPLESFEVSMEGPLWGDDPSAVTKLEEAWISFFTGTARMIAGCLVVLHNKSKAIMQRERQVDALLSGTPVPVLRMVDLLLEESLGGPALEREEAWRKNTGRRRPARLREWEEVLGEAGMGVEAILNGLYRIPDLEPAVRGRLRALLPARLLPAPSSGAGEEGLGDDGPKGDKSVLRAKEARRDRQVEGPDSCDGIDMIGTPAAGRPRTPDSDSRFVWQKQAAIDLGIEASTLSKRASRKPGDALYLRSWRLGARRFHYHPDIMALGPQLRKQA